MTAEQFAEHVVASFKVALGPLAARVMALEDKKALDPLNARLANLEEQNRLLSLRVLELEASASVAAGEHVGGA